MAKVIERGARNIARTAKQMVSAQITGVFLPHYPKSISSEMTGPLQAEIGPVSAKKQGGMGPGVEFGSINAGPIPHMMPAADQEIPVVERDIVQAAAKQTL